MDRHALRAIVNGAVHDDLGAAGALLTGAEARRRDGPFLSAAITRSGREGLPVHPRWPASLPARMPAVPSATPASLAGKQCSAPRQGRTIALPHWFRRLRIRWEIRDDIHEAFIFAITGHCPVHPGGPSCAAAYA